MRPEERLADDALAAARGGTALIVLQSLARLFSLAFVALVTRHLSPTEFGRYSTVAALVVFGNFLADFGTSPAITRLASRKPQEADSLLAGTLVASLALGCVVYIGTVAFAAVSYSGRTVEDVAIGALAIPAASVLSSVLAALDGVGLIARRSVLTALQTVIVSLGAVPVLFGVDVRAAIGALAVAPAIVLCLAFATARRAGVWRSAIRFDRDRIGSLIRVAFPFALAGGLTALTMRFDVILLSVVSTPAETASYDLALRILESVAYVSAAVCGPLLYILNRRLAEGDTDGAVRAYAEGMRVLYLIGIPLSIAIVILAKPIVSAALGSSFTRVDVPLAVMGAGLWLAFVVFVQGALIMSSEKMSRGVAVSALNAAVTVGLDVLLVPSHGARGAAVGMVGSWLFSVLAFDAFHRRANGIATPLPPVRCVLAAAVATIFLVLLRNEPLVVPAIVGGFTYVAMLFLTGAIRSRDLRRLRLVLSRAGARRG